MADQCIVCLGDLRTIVAADTPPEPAAAQVRERGADSDQHSSLRNTKLSAKSIDDDEDIIAHLLPCKHDLHNACLKPWVERANSCPICRAKFQEVQLSEAVGGEVIDSYAVQDKVQEAEIDPTMIVEDELFAVETWDPCVICGEVDNAHEQMWCDGCGKAAHIFCAGFEVDGPDVWYCETCLVDIENDTALPGLHSALRRQPRRRVPPTAQRNQPGGRRQDNSWARVWQEVSRRLDLDLDFPFDDDEPARDTRTPQQRREFRQWQRRFEVADQQGSASGAASRLRDIGARLQTQQPAAAQPESQEELRAWNAFDKARELQDPPSNRRKRKATASPASPQEPQQEQPKLKRPRLRRPAASAASPPAESSHAAAQRAGEPSNFLSSLLREVANRPGSDGSHPGSDQMSGGQYSPRNSSPVRSPTSSGYASPRALSASPPPPLLPNSPQMSGPDSPPFSPGSQTFSPFSPTVLSIGPSKNPLPDTSHRGRKRINNHDSGYDETYTRLSASSPSRAMSYSSKEEIQRMVKLCLGPRYRDKSITKDQYTDINRDVSRRLYELVGDASALTEEAAREKWQGIAEEEVRKAVEGLG